VNTWMELLELLSTVDGIIALVTAIVLADLLTPRKD
jgi:hypothetical protein